MIDRPGARYGRTSAPPRRRRVLAVVMFLLAVGAAVAVAVVGFQRLGTSAVRGELSGYRVIDDHTVEVTIGVTRDDPSRPVVCIVRARSRDGSETGRREVLVTPSEAATVQVTTVVRTSSAPAVGDVYGCGTDVPGYLRAP